MVRHLIDPEPVTVVRYDWLRTLLDVAMAAAGNPVEENVAELNLLLTTAPRMDPRCVDCWAPIAPGAGYAFDEGLIQRWRHARGVDCKPYDPHPAQVARGARVYPFPPREAT